MDNEKIDSAVRELFSKPFIKGFRAGAIIERTGISEAVIVQRLDELVKDGRLTASWELICNNCSTLMARYTEKPTKPEIMRCPRCQIEPYWSEPNLHKSYFRTDKP